MLRITRTYTVAGLQVEYRADVTAGSMWEWSTIGVESAGDILAEVQLRDEWLSRYCGAGLLQLLLSVDVEDMLYLVPDLQVDGDLARYRLPLVLVVQSVIGGSIIAAASLPDDVSEGYRYYLDLSTGARDYDEDMADQPCECPACGGVEGATDEHCLWVTDYPASAMVLFRLRPDLLSQYYDRPLRLYQAALHREQSRNIGMAVPGQQRRASAEHSQMVSDVFSQHGM